MNNSKKFFKLMNSLSVGILSILVLVGCGKVKTPIETAFEGSSPPAPPTVIGYKYYSSGTLQTVNSSFSSSVTIEPDFPSGSCAAPKTEVILFGTIDAETISNINVNGVSGATVQITGSSFEIKVCLAQGASSLSLKSVAESGATSTSVRSISVQIPTEIISIASDHPRYPNPGFKMSGQSQNISNAYSGNMVLSGSEMGEVTAQTVSSTGATGMTLSMGFVAMMPQETE
jgi:hypothetical protein